MVKLDENKAEIQRVQAELSRCKTKGPHYRDTAKRLRKLKQERAQALKFLQQAGRLGR